MSPLRSHSTSRPVAGRRALWLLALLILGGLVVLDRLRDTSPPGPDALPGGSDDTETIGRAFREGRSDLWVEASGSVDRMLPDDTRDSRHQRFIVRLASRQTVLISHNIDLAPRVPLQSGDWIRFRGEYEWNHEGGVVHWTHHDPRGQQSGGWIEHEGQRYR